MCSPFVLMPWAASIVNARPEPRSKRPVALSESVFQSAAAVRPRALRRTTAPICPRAFRRSRMARLMSAVFGVGERGDGDAQRLVLGGEGVGALDIEVGDLLYDLVVVARDELRCAGVALHGKRPRGLAIAEERGNLPIARVLLAHRRQDLRHGWFGENATEKLDRVAGLDRLDLLAVAEHLDRHTGLRLKLEEPEHRLWADLAHFVDHEHGSSIGAVDMPTTGLPPAREASTNGLRSVVLPAPATPVSSESRPPPFEGVDRGRLLTTEADSASPFSTAAIAAHIAPSERSWE